MARVTEFPSGHSFRPAWIWDLTLPVGLGMDNRRADVQLVQSLINEVAGHLSLRDFRKGKPGPVGMEFPPLKQLNEDGWWGPETAAAVDSYQVSAQMRTGGSRDGKVHPVHPLLKQIHGDPISTRFITAISSISARTIFRLNADHLLFKGRMMDESEFPAILRAEVKGS